MTNLFEIYIIELPKCKNNNTDNKKLFEWIEFLKNPEKLGGIGMSKEVKKAKECLEKISGNEEEKRWAELREKYILEINTAKVEAREDGFEEGKEEGREVGRKVGIKEGIKEGKQAFVSTLKELGVTYSDTLCKLREKFQLDEQTAEESMKLYWK